MGTVYYKNRLKHIYKSVWLYPFLLLFVLIGLTLFRISGTSIAVNSMLYSEKSEDPNLIAGAPRGVRSDEWLVNTQLIIAQEKNGYERINENIGNGQDMSILFDVPYKEWSVFFKPQNLSFFLLPLEYAFAFKWWLLLFLLLVSCYFFVLEIFPKKILRAALISIFVGLSPFIFWWYQSATILPIAYSFLMMLFTIRLFKAASFRYRLKYSLYLSYTLISFGLILYPPFQIPCLISSIIFLIGWWLEEYKRKIRFKKLKAILPYAITVIILVTFVGASFYLTRKEAIKTIESTVYPGSRVVTSGGAPFLLTFSSFLSPNLQYDEKAATGYLSNQSEASNFILIAPYLILPSIFLLYKAKKQKIIFWGLLIVNITLLLFILRMYVITPWLEPFYRVFLLDKVPNTRLLIGVGFIGILQLVLFIKALDRVKIKRKEYLILAAGGSLLAFVAMVLIGKHTINNYPVFISSFIKVLVYSLWIAFGIGLLLYNRIYLALAVLISFSILSVYRINPIYKGLGAATDIELIEFLESYPNESTWVVLDDRLLINHPLMAGKDSLSTVFLYPQLELWQELDKERTYDFIYNRFAHVLFSDDMVNNEPLYLQHADIFHVKFEPCSNFLQNHVEYALATEPLKNVQCTQLDRVLDFTKKDFYIYKITPR